jgi:putative phosphoesterase
MRTTADFVPKRSPHMSTDRTQIVDAKRIGFIADTHCQQEDGSDLPEAAMQAFAGVDLIVHLGDTGKAGVLERLRSVAPVMAPKQGGYHVIEAAGVRIGMTFDIKKQGAAISVDESGIDLAGNTLEEVLQSKFGEKVAAVAFAGTHRALEQSIDGVLFLNPGSARLPQDKPNPDDLGSVAILDVTSGSPVVSLLRLRK